MAILVIYLCISFNEICHALFFYILNLWVNEESYSQHRLNIKSCEFSINVMISWV